MNRTKLAALLASIALTLFAVGCGDSSNANHSNTSNTSNANAANSNAGTHK